MKLHDFEPPANRGGQRACRPHSRKNARPARISPASTAANGFARRRASAAGVRGRAGSGRLRPCSPAVRRCDPFARRQPVQRIERGADAQLRLPPAGDELLRLHEEFDLADAAPPQLQIVAFDGNPRMALMRVDLPLHGVDVGDGGVVEIFPPDIGCELAQEILARRDVAGYGARLDDRRRVPNSGRRFRNNAGLTRPRARSGSRRDRGAGADRCGTHSPRACARPSA